ncbi:hypothetical protein ACJZ2D_015733 [Fusarium nematophilum]
MMATQYTNNLLRCVARNQVCKSFGIKVSPNAQLVQVARHAGFESLFIDLEHAWLTLAEASNLCNVGHLAGITPFVRVPHQCGNGFVQRVLDGGAMGVVFPHIENAVDNADTIAAVDGVDVLLVGSNDLSIDMGVGGRWDSDEYCSSMERVSQACRRHDKIFGVAGVYENPKLHEWFINTLGARFLLVQQDMSLIASGGRKAVEVVPRVRP